jgi:hypothetical protein
MRHFLSEALTILGLSGGMAVSATEGTLVARTGSPYLITAGGGSALVRAVGLPPIAAATDADLNPAALAEEEAVGVVRQAFGGKGWTKTPTCETLLTCGSPTG